MTLGSSRAERVRGLLGKPGLWWVLAALAMLLAAPSLTSGFQTEDYVLREASRGASSVFHNLFGQPGDVRWQNYGAQDFGTLPWLTPSDWRVAFWRPFASLLHNLEYRWLPESSALMHLHSLLWLGVLVAATAALYRRLLAPAWLAGLAGLLYAIEDGHGFAVGWLANRSALIAAALAAVALLAHDRWRRDGRRAGAALAPVALALALLAGESALGVTGFFLAHALFLDRARASRRLLAAVPWLLVVLSWSLAYKLQGYGADGSGAYVDPLTQPLELVRATAVRLPALLFGLFGAAPIDLLALADPDWIPWMLAGACLFLAAVAALLGPLLRAQPAARFFAAGTLFSLLPACTAFPAERMLFIPGIGASALIAIFIGEALRGAGLWQSALRKRAVWLLAGVWLLVHGAGAALLLPIRSRGLERYSAWVEELAEQAYRGVRPQQQLVMVNVLDYYTGSLMLAMRAARGQPIAAHTRIVHGGQDALALYRPDTHTLVFRPADGFLGTATNAVYRSPARPMQKGQGLQLTGVQVIVTEVDRAGMPLEATFRFAWPLESENLRFVAWDGRRYRELALPAVGQRTIVAPRRVDPLKIWL